MGGGGVAEVTGEENPPANTSLRALALSLLFLLGLASFESGTAIAKDDFGYLMWGLLERDDWLAWVDGPGWFSYRRPLNALLWWVSARQGIDGELVRWAQVLLWVAFAVPLLLLAHRPSSRGLVAVVLALATNQVFVDLLHWRSWVTTTGSLAFFTWGQFALVRGWRPAAFGLLLSVSAGFKEVAAITGICLSADQPRHRWVSALVLLALALGAWSSSHKLGLGNVPANVEYHAGTLALFAPIVPLITAKRFPRVSGWWWLALLPLGVLPEKAAAVVFLAACFLVLARRPTWAVAGGAALVLPLLGAYQARQYLLEFWAVTLISALQLRGPVPVAALVTMVGIGLPSAIDFERNRAALRAEFARQEAFLRTFHPPPAKVVYQPDPTVSWNLDGLYWVSRGAALEGEPPAGSRPAQVGPLSGIWADLATDGATAEQGP